MTDITLPPDFEAWARAEVAAGRAESVEALVAKGLNGYRAEIEYIRGKLDEARASIAAGKGIPLEDFLKRVDGWIEEDEAAARAALKAAE